MNHLNQLFLVFITITISFAIGLIIVKIVDNRLKKISINMPSINLSKNSSDNKFNKNLNLFMNNKSMKCKCSVENNDVENFTNYSKPEKIKRKKISNRIPYNKKIVDNYVTAEQYYNNKYNTPIIPVNNEFKIKAMNNLNYENIGDTNSKVIKK